MTLNRTTIEKLVMNDKYLSYLLLNMLYMKNIIYFFLKDTQVFCKVASDIGHRESPLISLITCSSIIGRFSKLPSNLKVFQIFSHTKSPHVLLHNETLVYLVRKNIFYFRSK